MIALTNWLAGKIDLKLLGRCFLIGAAVNLLLIPADGFWTYFHREFAGNRMPADVSPVQKDKKLEPFEAYQKAFERSGLFGNVSEAGPQFQSVPIAELAKDFRLKGVVLMDEPEAIIENAKTQSSSFVRQGQKVGELEIKTIKEGYVVLSYGKDEVRLEIQ